MLNTYMGYSRSAGQAEGACLIFAHTSREAKRVCWPTVCDWFDGGFTDVAIKRLQAPHLMAEADAVKLAAGTPHVIECPNACPVCEYWGNLTLEDGNGCEGCGGECYGEGCAE